MVFEWASLHPDQLWGLRWAPVQGYFRDCVLCNYNTVIQWGNIHQNGYRCARSEFVFTLSRQQWGGQRADKIPRAWIISTSDRYFLLVANKPDVFAYFFSFKPEYVIKRKWDLRPVKTTSSMLPRVHNGDIPLTRWIGPDEGDDATCQHNHPRYPLLLEIRKTHWNNAWWPRHEDGLFLHCQSTLITHETNVCHL